MSAPDILQKGRPWRETLDDKFADLKKLPAGSDSWTAHRPAHHVVETARLAAEKFVASAPRPLPDPFVAASSEGGLQLKWVIKGGEYSLFIYPDESIEFLFVRDHQEPVSGAVEVKDIPELSKLLVQ